MYNEGAMDMSHIFDTSNYTRLILVKGDIILPENKGLLSGDIS